MAIPITPAAATPAIAPTRPAASASASAATTAPGFGDSLARMVHAVESSSSHANDAVAQMLDGTGDVHDAMIALQRAELNLQLTVQVRNKFIQAYQDIMRMPV